MFAYDLGDQRTQLCFHGSIDDIRVILTAIKERSLLSIFALGKIVICVTIIIFCLDFNQRRLIPKRLIFKIRRNGHHFNFINIIKLFSFGDRCTGHTRKLLIHAEIILNRDGGIRYVFCFNLYAFFGFHRLM